MPVSSDTILAGVDPFEISAISLLLFQCFIVIGTAKLLAQGLRYLNQPVVIAEVVGGLILGGSAMSKITAFKANIFPDSSLPGLSLVANFGLVLYLFLIGLELDPEQFVRSVGSSIPIALVGVFLPFGLTVAIAKLLYNTYIDSSVSFLSFFIFCGVAMSITAFPVLARILADRGLLHTKIGQVTFAAAAVNDVLAWILLVLVIAIVNNAGGATASTGQYLTALYVFLCVAAFAVFLWFTLRPFYKWLIPKAEGNENVTSILTFTTFMLVLLSGWFTEIIGVQAIFGSFLVGAIIPHDHGFAVRLAKQTEDLVVIVFLPLFFAYSGLNTRIDQLTEWKDWGITLLVITVACAGKMLGSAITAKVCGMSWREGFAIGILMNTKGLVELIVLNVGLKSGVITPKVFSIFVVMAIMTTLLTTPLIAIVYPSKYYMDENIIESPTLSKPDEAGGEGSQFPSPEENDVHILAFLPNLNAVESLSSLVSHASTSKEIVLYGLRLMPVDNRLSTLMAASEQGHTVRSDPILSVFRTLFSSHGTKSHSLLSFTNDSAATIIEATTHVSANVIVIPSKGQNKLHVQEIVPRVPPTTAILEFIDKGFRCDHTLVAGVSESRTVSKIFQSKKQADSNHCITIVIILDGKEDIPEDSHIDRLSSILFPATSTTVVYKHIIIGQPPIVLSDPPAVAGQSSSTLETTAQTAHSRRTSVSGATILPDTVEIATLVNTISSLVSSPTHDLVIIGDSLITGISNQTQSTVRSNISNLIISPPAGSGSGTGEKPAQQSQLRLRLKDSSSSTFGTPTVAGFFSEFGGLKAKLESDVAASVLIVHNGRKAEFLTVLV